MPTFWVEWLEPNEETPSTAGDHAVQSKTDLLLVRMKTAHPGLQLMPSYTHTRLWPNCLLYQREEKLHLQKHARMSTRPYFVFVHKHRHRGPGGLLMFSRTALHIIFLYRSLSDLELTILAILEDREAQDPPVSLWLLHLALLLGVCAATPGFLCGCWALKFRFPWLCSRYHIHQVISPTPVTLLTITNGEPSSHPSHGEEIDEAPPINKILFGLKGERMWVNTSRALLSERISLKCFMPFVTA